MTTEDERYKVTIIGAGASGLQCAHDLVTEYGIDPQDLLIVEARNRIGGRIHTTAMEARTSTNGESVTFSVDHGAAWVHGTGHNWNEPLVDETAIPEPNPMMKLLEPYKGPWTL